MEFAHAASAIGRMSGATPSQRNRLRRSGEWLGSSCEEELAIFGALIKILSRSEAGFDPDRLVSTLQARKAEEWGTCVNGLKGGDVRATALQKLIMEAYHQPARSVAAQ
jgi:hypothetical protein